tara:strand:- start:65 stop:166 length:102 start_codon:yes stop_codon:yes gene_type:complete
MKTQAKAKHNRMGPNLMTAIFLVALIKILHFVD